jgi:pimeloyl-ACP methyl ester carboxylesterase
MKIHPAWLLLWLPLANGCQGESFKPGGCGLTGYRWLPREQVGAALKATEVADLKMSATTIDALLSAGGYGQFTPVPYGARVFTVRYSTQDRGQLVEATGTLGVPFNQGDAPGQFPLVLFLHGTSGFTNACAPSRQVADQGLIVALLASQGWMTVVPDYIGMDGEADPAAPPELHHAYLGMEQTAVGSLDMLRATNDLLSGQLSEVGLPGTEVVLWGGSQGGHAVFACDRLAPFYAPEFEIRAAVAMVPPTDLIGLGEYALSSANPATIALAASLVSLRRWYNGGAPLDQLLTDQDPNFLASLLLSVMDSTCDFKDQFGELTSVSQVYQPAAIEAAAAGRLGEFEPWGCYMSENSLATTSTPRRNRTPILFVLGEQDTLVDTKTERRDFERLCAQGYALKYLECAGAGHTDASGWSVPEQFDFVRERLAGEPIPDADLCVRHPVQRCALQPD